MKFDSTCDPERQATKPRYRPGDIVKTKDGGVGVICEAQTVINGTPMRWNDERWIGMDVKEWDGWEPSYSLQPVPGFKGLKFNAWWKASEFDSVKFGLLHSL